MLLTPGEVDLWRVSLDSFPPATEFLSPDELDRARRFRFARDRDRFIARRGVLRRILSAYVGSKPGDLQFEHNPFGKPALTGTPIHFSVSHSNGIALYAVSTHEVGVDIEAIRDDFPFAKIAERFFNADEIEYLNSLLPSLQRRAFYSLWTRKEAYLKALGLGITENLDTPVPLTGNAQVAGPDGFLWNVTDLQVGTDYSAALAAKP